MQKQQQLTENTERPTSHQTLFASFPVTSQDAQRDPRFLSFRDAPSGAGPESISPGAFYLSMDSGLARSLAPRNDGTRVWIASLALAMTAERFWIASSLSLLAMTDGVAIRSRNGLNALDHVLIFRTV